MYREKLCLGLSASFGLSYEEQIIAFRETGFECFFANYGPDSDMPALRRCGDMEGMLFQSIHAPFTKMASMWEKTDITQSAVEELIRCARSCAEVEVPLMIVHAFIGFEKHSPTDFGVDCFGKVVDAAERLGVSIAFENTEGEEYLAALMDAFVGRGNVGFCWDTGHEMCYNRSKDMLALYGDRLMCTHINDNLGIKDFDGRITYIDDLHLLPFDGIGDWADIASRLDRHGFGGPLTFELATVSKPGRHENDAYARMAPREYITEAYKRACRVAALRKQSLQKHD